ncbi:phage protease [Azospirillum picis]|uniref:Phage I-like protein n=1 Tax=Azospirillum picis TaxID=488438 RepID=A0ABU0MNT4_9PROT|nr:phage protease [Azospirillum picis]MBP2301301.1 phage I-like protein [Azospirillum picis]MDQ0535132.1 phage I-like protein [Azospirillum picis]
MTIQRSPNLPTIAGEAVATCAFFADLTTADGIVPRRIRLLPTGAVTPNDGREPWTVTDAAAVVAASLATAPHGLLAIDYDHAADLAAPKGGPAPAAGWITSLQVTAEGIQADVDWTEAGARAIAAKEYRFISPSFRHGPDRQVTRIIGAGLTNRPALSDLPALAHQHGTSMDPILAALLEALGLPKTADQTTALAAVTGLKATAASTTALCAAAGLNAGATADQVATAVASLQATAGQVKAIASAAGLAESATPLEIATAVASLKANATAVTLLETQVATLSGRLQALEGDKLAGEVDAAIAAGKFVPAQRAELVALASANKPIFDRLVAGAVPVLLPGEQLGGGAPAGGGLTAEQKAVCAAMGLSEDDFKKSLGTSAGKEG